MADVLTVEVLEDGTLKISTDAVSMPNHTNAEGLLRELSKEMGGDTVRVKKAGVHTHTHDGITHTH